MGINNSGTAVGYLAQYTTQYTTPIDGSGAPIYTGIERTIVYNQGHYASPTIWSPANTPSVRAYDIDDSGRTVGVATDSKGGQHGLIIDGSTRKLFDYTENGVVAKKTVATTITSDGKVGGYYEDAAGQVHGFVIELSKITYNGSL